MMMMIDWLTIARLMMLMEGGDQKEYFVEKKIGLAQEGIQVLRNNASVY